MIYMSVVTIYLSLSPFFCLCCPTLSRYSMYPVSILSHIYPLSLPSISLLLPLISLSHLSLSLPSLALSPPPSISLPSLSLSLTSPLPFPCLSLQGFSIDLTCKQLTVDFVNQSVLQISSQDVEGKRSDKTDFAERLGAMNRRWQILQGLIIEKVATAPPPLAWRNDVSESPPTPFG